MNEVYGLLDDPSRDSLEDFGSIVMFDDEPQAFQVVIPRLVEATNQPIMTIVGSEDGDIGEYASQIAETEAHIALVDNAIGKKTMGGRIVLRLRRRASHMSSILFSSSIPDGGMRQTLAEEGARYVKKETADTKRIVHELHAALTELRQA